MVGFKLIHVKKEPQLATNLKSCGVFSHLKDIVFTWSYHNIFFLTSLLLYACWNIWYAFQHGVIIGLNYDLSPLQCQALMLMYCWHIISRETFGIMKYSENAWFQQINFCSATAVLVQREMKNIEWRLTSSCKNVSNNANIYFWWMYWSSEVLGVKSTLLLVWFNSMSSYIPALLYLVFLSRSFVTISCYNTRPGNLQFSIAFGHFIGSVLCAVDIPFYEYLPW